MQFWIVWRAALSRQARLPADGSWVRRARLGARFRGLMFYPISRAIVMRSNSSGLTPSAFPRRITTPSPGSRRPRSSSDSGSRPRSSSTKEIAIGASLSHIKESIAQIHTSMTEATFSRSSAT